jgi:enamine deaminase RidA (YjgF/YER057c/UK114 family)
MSIVRIGGTNRYSDVVVFDKRVYLSGVVPNIYAPVYEQTKEVLMRIESILTSAGSSKKNILNMTIYLIDEKSYEDMNRAFDEWIPKDCAPARATIGNVKFPNPLWKVEITLIACTGELPKQEMNSSYINYIV